MKFESEYIHSLPHVSSHACVCRFINCSSSRKRRDRLYCQGRYIRHGRAVRICAYNVDVYSINGVVLVYIYTLGRAWQRFITAINRWISLKLKNSQWPWASIQGRAGIRGIVLSFRKLHTNTPVDSLPAARSLARAIGHPAHMYTHTRTRAYTG